MFQRLQRYLYNKMISISRQVPLIFVLSCLVYITTSLVVPLSQSPFISWRKQYSDVSETKSIKVDFQNNIEKSEHIFKIPSCATIPDVPMDRRPWDRNGTLSVMNYNAEWLFYDGGSGSLKCPGPQCPWTTKEKAKQHFHRVATVISEADFPDIIHLSEVESCAALARLAHLVDVLHKKKYDGVTSGYRFYLIPGKDTATGQQVGMLTRIDPVISLSRTESRAPYPIDGSKCEVTMTSKTYGLSKHYITKFLVSGRSIVFAGLHLVAFPDRKDRCVMREAQAMVLSQYIREIHDPATDDLIILGDFNEFDEEILDAAGEIDTPISSTLSILRHTINPPLFNMAHLWPSQESKYTNWFDRNRNCIDDGFIEHSLIDHILVSHGLKNHTILSKPIHSYEQKCGKLDSDHWPILVKFQFT